jgi:hypothetical protein
MNGFILKMIAIITMFIDHYTAILIPDNTMEYIIGRSIGRLAFPIFCFLLVEGFYHTKSVNKYLIRLGIFALISEIPFDLAFSDTTTKYGFLNHQNIFFTLFIGLFVIYLMRIIEKRYTDNMIMINILNCIVVVAGGSAASFLATDYSFMGVLMIVTFYLFRERKFTLTIVLFVINTLNGGPLQLLATLSMIFIVFYNGKRGPKFNKYIFYGFYPVHILVLYLISVYF